MRKFIRKRLEEVLPETILTFIRKMRMTPIERRNALLETCEQRQLAKLISADYSYMVLSNEITETSKVVQHNAQDIYGDQWNYYSNALRREVSYIFQESIDYLSGKFESISFLEIGSCQGLSMSLVGTLLKQKNLLEKLYSIDPYFDGGYFEGKLGIVGVDRKIQVDKSTRQGVPIMEVFGPRRYTYRGYIFKWPKKAHF